MRGLWHVLSLFATGGGILYVFFSAVAEVSPAEAAGAGGVCAGLAALLFVRRVRLDYELRSPAGDPEMRSARNRQRERRGF